MKFREIWKSVLNKTNIPTKVSSININNKIPDMEKTIQFNFGYGFTTSETTFNVILPFSSFAIRDDGIVPDFSRIRIIDCGIIAFGDYEVTSEEIYKEFKK